MGGVRDQLRRKETLKDSIDSRVGAEMKSNGDGESRGEVKKVNTHHECQRRIASAACSMD